MHEFGIMESALALAEKNARTAGATQIHRLKVRVGKLSGVVPEALRFAFAALKANTLAAAAEFEAQNLNYECPRCHQPSGDLRRGKEMDLASLEIS